MSDITTSDMSALCDRESAICSIETIIADAGTQKLGVIFHDFDTGGFTLAVVLAESHIAVHTWPERGLVSLDVFLCNYQRDNTDRAELIHKQVCELFSPIETETYRLERKGV